MIIVGSCNFEDSEKFQSALKGLNEDSFKSYHRDDALYFSELKMEFR